jgi:hypothetical protein
MRCDCGLACFIKARDAEHPPYLKEWYTLILVGQVRQYTNALKFICINLCQYMDLDIFLLSDLVFQLSYKDPSLGGQSSKVAFGPHPNSKSTFNTMKLLRRPCATFWVKFAAR